MASSAELVSFVPRLTIDWLRNDPELISRDVDGTLAPIVDRPEDAVRSADRLVTALMRDRGYPTEAFDQQVRDLSADQGRTLQRYRAAHQVEHLSTRHQATTEELRGAMARYRALFDELLSDDGRVRRAAS